MKEEIFIDNTNFDCEDFDDDMPKYIICGNPIITHYEGHSDLNVINDALRREKSYGKKGKIGIYKLVDSLELS